VTDNIGEYTSNTGIVKLVGFKLTSIVGNTSILKITAVPANQSAISPTREDIVIFDEGPSFSSGVIVTST